MERKTMRRTIVNAKGQKDPNAARYDAEFKRKTDKSQKIMKRYRNTLRALAK
jgi:hypothetical protein